MSNDISRKFESEDGTPSPSNKSAGSSHRIRRTSNQPIPSSDTGTPHLDHRDPSIPAAANATKPPVDPEHNEDPPEKWSKKCKRCLYDKKNGTILGRTCSSWARIMLYSIMYLMFITTYTMIFLYFTLFFVKSKFAPEEPLFSYLTYSPVNVDLTGVPLAEHNYPLIWYRAGERVDYIKYVAALDELLQKNRAKRDLGSHLGPCGQRPYGYGEKPCILIKIDVDLDWVGKPLEAGSSKAKKAPKEVQKWIERDSEKYWLHCAGYHDYDKEHLGKIEYYPDPPGFDSSLYPLNVNSTSPVVAFQVSNFTLGISILIECKLWFEDGYTSIAFMLYVSPKRN